MTIAELSSARWVELAATLRTFGFIVLRKFFDPQPLAAEIDAALHAGRVADSSNSKGIRFQYVPMMTARTPISLELLDRASDVATALLGGSVLPTRAKGVLYSGDTPWHVDSIAPLASLGFLAYLEPVAAENGALRVLPGSHRAEFAAAIRALGVEGMAAAALPGHIVATEPGDVIVLDEHLLHASCGGGLRRQWRVDYVSAPTDADRELKSYFEAIYPPDWDGGYDVARYPSYDHDWRHSTRPAAARLEVLGVYELAARQEASVRPKG